MYGRPFKSTLFAATQSNGHPIAVQPVTIAYVKSIHGWDLPIEERRIHPWIGEDELVPHLWTMLKHRGVVADVLFHPPVAADTFASRKELAEHCRAASAYGLVVARRRSALPVAEGAGDWLDSPVFGLLG